MAKKAAKKTDKKQDPVYKYDWVTQEMLDAMEKAGITDPVEQRNLLQVILAENGGKPRPEMYNGPSRRDYFEGKYGFKTSAGIKLGNKLAGDGERFAGRGLFQLSGRDNYERMQRLSPYKVADNPDLMNNREIDNVVSFIYLKDRAKTLGIKDFKDPAQIHRVIRPSESWQERSERTLPISDVDWQVLQDERAARKNQPQQPAPQQQPQAQPQQKTPYGVRMTLEQFKREQNGGISPDTTPPAR